MSLKRTKDQLVSLLGQPDNMVIALSGRWGTGKTYLWNEVKAASTDPKVGRALYVSLFGLSGIDQVKRKLLESAIPGVDSHGGLFDGIKNIFAGGITAASAHYKALAAIKDLNLLLMAPALLRNKVIVIDDIERKHEKLGIDEVLGFIDEYSRQYSARFVLVLNDDQLLSKADQESLWTTFREKVIDQEIRLSTTPDEAFSIALGIAPSAYSEALKRASLVCGLTNIRIVVKIIRAANQLLGGRPLGQAIQARVMPSIVLFAAIHFRGLVDGPDFKFALSAGNPDWVGYLEVENGEPTPEEIRRQGWRMLMHELGINGCDDFEKRLVEFLESGLFDAASIQQLIDGYVLETEAMEARNAVHAFLMRVVWDHRTSEVQLVTEAAGFAAKAHLLDPFLATQLDMELQKMPGGAAIGDAVIDGWIAAFKAGNPTRVNDENPFNNPLHAKIKAEFDAIKATEHANATVVDACMHIIQHSGWGTLQEVAMRRATVADFEAAIRGMTDGDQFRHFMRRMIEMRLQRGAYEHHFGAATHRFVEACRNIANDATSPRLATLVKRLFKGTALEAELTSSAPPQAPNTAA